VNVVEFRKSCRHADSLYGRCEGCGMTWGEQERARARPPYVVERRPVFVGKRWRVWRERDAFTPGLDWLAAPVDGSGIPISEREVVAYLAFPTHASAYRLAYWLARKSVR
jgi:hypothetical protein